MSDVKKRAEWWLRPWSACLISGNYGFIPENSWSCRGFLAFVFEVFDLAEAFLGGGFGFVGAAEILAFFG